MQVRMNFFKSSVTLYEKLDNSNMQLRNMTSPINLVTTSHITLNFPSQQFADSNIVLEVLGAWLQPPISRCGRKFSSQPLQDTPHFENVSLSDDGNAIISWYCSGKRSYSPRVMLNLKSFLIISVDVLIRHNKNTPTALPALTLDQVPALILVFGQELTFYGVTLWNGSHYISVFQFNNIWFMYDGLKEYNQQGSGISYCHTKFEQPLGYSLSYLVYCI